MLSQEVVKRLSNCTVASTVRQEDDEAAWLAQRTKGIGGSDIGAICGVSPFSSARQVYFRKTGQYQDLVEATNSAKERMHFGHMLEPIVADEFVKRTGLKAISVDASFAHKDYPWALANVDRLIVDDSGCPIGVLECKTTSEYMNEEWSEGEILESYLYQLQWYLFITGLERGWFACLVGGNKFYHYEVFRNDELINDVLLPAAKHFWFENVLKLEEPPMQSTDTDVANTLYTSCDKNSEIVLDDDQTNDLLRTIVESKAKVKELEGIIEAAQNQIKDKLQNHEIGYAQDYTVKWSPRKQSRVDTTVLKTDFPEVYEKVLKTTEYRSMTVKGVKV